MSNDLIEEILAEKHLKACIAAGRNEPDKSHIRSAWKSVGFYVPSKPMTLVTTWRH